ncbi:MAG: cobalamin B12-binding domain-containing protein [Planctomycetes bacterium]|nr:cobalamin B12-binding domain-containing protein [Planctomycetota bacterium]
MKRPTVLLVTPPYHAGVVESAGRWPNLAFIYLAGELRAAGFDPVYYDAMSKFHTFADIEKELDRVKPDIVASTAITASLDAAVGVLRRAKQRSPSVTTVLGGIHPTFCYDDVLRRHADAVDYCVLGEGERTLPELLQAIGSDGDIARVPGIAYRRDGRVARTPPRPFLDDLDRLRPAWDIVQWKDYPLYFIDDSRVAIVSSSRGCVYQCSFCSQHKFWQATYRERCAESFVEEMERLTADFGVNVFFIADEYPTRNRERWERILDLLRERRLGAHVLLETCVRDILRDQDILWKYREAGVLFIYMGVEAAKAHTLKLFRKDIKFEQSRQAIHLVKSHDMITESSLIVGLPDETPENLRETRDLAALYDPDYMHFLFITPWPYADMYRELEPHIEIHDFSKYNLVEPVIRPVAMTRDQLFQEVLTCYRTYYMRKVKEWCWSSMSDLKRRCLLKGLKAIMDHSFLKDRVSSLGAMPKEVRELLDNLGRPQNERTQR